jgi:hypothetical protein
MTAMKGWDTGGTTMSLTELLPAIHALPRADKLRLMQVLVAEIASEEAVALPSPAMVHTIWTPYDAYDAAETLLQVLHKDQAAAI